MKIKRFNESYEGMDKSLEELVRRILDAAKLDVDAIEESDPEFIPYVGDMIQMWANENINL